MSENRYAKDMHPKVRELKDALESIGWRFRACGCGVYNIQDQRENDTAFQITHDYPELRYEPFRSTYGAFAEKEEDCGRNGAIVFELPSCVIKVTQDKRCISVKPVNNHHVFISFYNHDRKAVSSDG